MSAGVGSNTERFDYWDGYYAAAASGGPGTIPSQFAVFVGSELDRPSRVLEFGCGAGRDSIFFASLGHSVVGMDASEQAVKACRESTVEFGDRARFIQPPVTADDLESRLRTELSARTQQRPLVVYARFFVHAITDAEERAFLDIASALTATGDLLAVEYRTVRDSSGAKVTGTHYRRFVDPPVFQTRVLRRGFDVGYAVEGFGFAKYRQDDAYVARAIFVKS